MDIIRFKRISPKKRDARKHLFFIILAVYGNFNLGGVGANFLATAVIIANAALVSVNASLSLTNVVAALVVAGAVTN